MVTPADSELVAPMDAEKHGAVSAHRFVSRWKSLVNAALIPNSSSDDDSAEKGHLEQVNLQNNISARYVPTPYSNYKAHDIQKQ